ncbi:insulinase family protein [Leptolyngbyaceae cyanobacterium CCMR0082]|uniref:Insulinase family protein n=2 Tax=Adonisia turfae TaxID=2950184 RepID=A0A6M0S2D3_9CYAN|nr:pitrilysin family protein [Adonisia turfae]MDV3347749.1 pitrilysin family protein [Leptothoe sp. LEGE 181152]NEZ60500.1 insulinase family protein [Adonisia turfae CCMR0081]NEZ62625.1 insulinase family protein [Adonisia turfae CCMR0082]
MFWFSKRRLTTSFFLAMATLGLVLTLGWSKPANAVTAHHYTDLEFEPLSEIQIPEFERYELPNGLVVYLMEKHDLPLVSGSATFRAGEFMEPEGKTGLASIMGESMRVGGTVNYTPDQLNQFLEQRAASVESSLSATTGSASFSALSEDLADVFAIFSEVIQQPAFAPEKIDLIKSQYRGSIARRNDDPDDVTTREFRKLIYGDESPFARMVEYSDIENISRDDVIDFYQTAIQPSGTILGISGDFDATQMKVLIEEFFADWSPSARAKANVQVPQVEQQTNGLYVVDQPQLTQSYIHIGHLGGRLDSPDHAPMVILNEVLNGFGGRLFNDIRSRQGLAYVVYAFWSPRYDYPGLFIGGGQTRSETTVPFIETMYREIQRVRQEPIKAEELQYAKDAVLNSFVFNFATPEQTLSRLIRYEYYGYPSDFVFEFQKAVESTTIEQVLEAAQRNLKPSDLVTIVVGNIDAIDPSLGTLAEEVKITPIDISIPESSV